ncbi:MAG: aldo/keto reductase [Acidobacteriota bacterium]
MRVRTLGADGLQVAAVGAGDVSLARAALRGVDASELERALCEAIEGGIELIDVAHERDAQRLVGQVVRALRVRDRAVVACRLATARDLRPQVEACLRESKLEVLPLVQLPLTGLDPDDRGHAQALAAIAHLEDVAQQLVREGKVLRWSSWAEGYSPDAPLPVGDWLVATSLPFNLCERQAEPLLAGCVLARRPLAGGALAGALGPGVKLARTDDRRDADFARAAVGVAKLAALVKREPPAARSCDAARAQLDRNVRPAHLECTTVAELALRWVIDRGAIALPRLHRREHVAEAIAAAAAPPLTNPLPELDT